MCSPAALETLLRGAMRKQAGVDCVAIAVDQSSYFLQFEFDCLRAPILTQLSGAIVDGRLVAQVNGPSDPPLIDCEEQQGIDTILQGLLYPTEENPGVYGMAIWSYIGETACLQSCEDDAVSLSERIKGSLVSDIAFRNYAIRSVDVSSGEPLDCDDMTPTETLLRSAFVRQSDGGWAMRIAIEI